MVLCNFQVNFFFQAEDGIRVIGVTGVQTCALPISRSATRRPGRAGGCCGVPPAVSSSPTATSRRRACATARDRKSVVEGKRVDLGGRRNIKKKKNQEEK